MAGWNRLREAIARARALARMGAHALGAAADAVQAVGPEHAGAELAWQLAAMSPGVRAALARLPAVGEDRAGPLGPGRLASGALGSAVRALQAGLLGHVDKRVAPRVHSRARG